MLYAGIFGSFPWLVFGGGGFIERCFFHTIKLISDPRKTLGFAYRTDGDNKNDPFIDVPGNGNVTVSPLRLVSPENGSDALDDSDGDGDVDGEEFIKSLPQNSPSSMKIESALTSSVEIARS